MTEKKENGVKEEVEINKEQDLESKYKVLAEVEEKTNDVLDAKKKELEDIEASIVKAKYAKKKIDETFDDELDEKPVIDQVDIASLVSKELAKNKQQTDGQHFQKLISEVEDPYKAKAIQNEVNKLDKNLSANERFNLANTLVEAKLQSKIKNVPSPDKPGGEAPSQGKQDQDKFDEYTKSVYERAGIGDMLKKNKD